MKYLKLYEKFEDFDWEEEEIDNFPKYDVGNRIRIIKIKDEKYNNYLNKIGIIAEIDRKNKNYYIEFFDDGGYLNDFENDEHLYSEVFFENEIEKI